MTLASARASIQLVRWPPRILSFCPRWQVPVCQHTRRRRLLRFLASENMRSARQRHSNAEKTRDSKIHIMFGCTFPLEHRSKTQETFWTHPSWYETQTEAYFLPAVWEAAQSKLPDHVLGDLVFMHLWWDFMYQYSAICTQFLVHLDFKGTFWNEMWRMILWLKEFRVDYTMSRVACFFLVFLFVWQNQCLFPWDFEGVGVHQAPKPEARTAPAVRYGELGEKGIRAHFLVFW